MEVSVFNGRDPHLQRFADGVVDVAWNDLANLVCATAWSPAIFGHVVVTNSNGTTSSGLHRLASNVKKIEILAFDVDEGGSVSKATNALKHHGLAGIIGATRNHQKPKNEGPACDRFRIILPLAHSLESEAEFKNVWFHGLQCFPYADKACKDRSRLFFPCSHILANVPGRPFPVCIGTRNGMNSGKTNEVAFQKRTAQEWQEMISVGVGAGERNHSVASLSGHLLRKNVDPFVVLELLRSWNHARNRPPLGDEEVVRTVNSIAGKELVRRRGERNNV